MNQPRKLCSAIVAHSRLANLLGFLPAGFRPETVETVSGQSAQYLTYHSCGHVDVFG